MPSPNIAIEDVDAYSDSGSTISLASCGSGGNEFSPRPPRDGSVRSKSVKGRRSKISNTSRSPYASRQQIPSRKSELASKSMGRNLWMTAMKNGTGSLSTNNTAMNTWAGARPSHANKKRPGSRTRNFSDVVDLTDGKSKFFSKSATMSYSEPYATSGGPALKPAEDYYDEIIELKKIINLLKEENNKVNTKLHRVEQENVLKDRQIEDLLNSRKQPEDLRRTLTDKRGDSSSIVTSLKQKLHAVERTVKEKEGEINKMKRDLKTTDVEELKIQSEVYYQEVQRLQLTLLQLQQERMDELYAEDDMPSSRFDKSPVSVPQQKLQKDIEILKAENKSLKKELISAVESQSKGEAKPLKVEYADMTRGQLLQTIHELEERVDEMETKASSLQKEKMNQNDRKGSKKKTKDRKSSVSSTASTVEEKESELMEENEKQRKIIEKLKEDRTHYRLIADDLRKQLKERESELEELQLHLSKDTSAGGGVSSSGRKTSVTSTSSQYSPRKDSITAKEREEKMEREFQEFQQRHAAKVLQKQWRTYKGSKGEREVRQKAEDEAAKTLQREWRKHLNKKESSSQNEAITDIQAAFRGHLTRKERLNRIQQDDMDSDDAIVDLQSALRGHLTRSRNREEPEDDQWSRDMLRDGELSESGDSDNDIVIGKPPTSGYRKLSSHSSDKSPFSAKKRSSFTEMSVTSEATPPKPVPRTRPPHSVPHINKTVSTTPHTPSQQVIPPSPTPRRKQPAVSVDDDSDSDDVVISGSKSAVQKAPQNALNKSSLAHPTESSKTPGGGTRAEVGKDKLDNVFITEDDSPDSDSDNELVVCGKPSRSKPNDGANTDIVNSRKDKRYNINDESKKCKDSLGTQRNNDILVVKENNEGKIAQQSAKAEIEIEQVENKANTMSESNKENKIAKNHENALTREDTEFLNKEEKRGQSLMERKDERSKIQEVMKHIVVDNADSLSSTTVSTNRISEKDVSSNTLINHEGYAKAPSRKCLSSNQIPSCSTAFSSGSTNHNLSSILTYDVPSLSTNQNSDTKLTNDESTKQLSTVAIKDSFLGSDERRQDTGTKAVNNMPSSLSVTKTELSTGQVTPSSLTNENPFIALTNGSPGLPANRFFRGMEWAKANTSSRRNTQSKHVENEIKIIDSPRKDQLTNSCQATSDEPNNTQESSQTSAQLPFKDDKPVPKARDKTKSMSANDQVDGLTKQINPQRTIDEAPEDSNDDIVVSSRAHSKPSTSRHVTSSRDRPAKPSRYEIVDSDEDEEEVIVSTKSTARNSARSSVKSDRGGSTKGKQRLDDGKTKIQSLKKVQRNQQRDLEESEDDSEEDDVVVTPSKSGGFGSRGSSSKYSKTSTPKRGSLVDSLLAPAPRSSMDNRGRKLIVQDDDDDDDDIVLSSFSKRSSRSSSTSKKKDSLASLWSDPKPKKKSSFGFSSFEDDFSSKKRNTSSLDEFF